MKSSALNWHDYWKTEQIVSYCRIERRVDIFWTIVYATIPVEFNSVGRGYINTHTAKWFIFESHHLSKQPIAPVYYIATRSVKR